MMEDEKRKRALLYLNITGAVQGVLGMLLLILGLVSRSKHGPYAEGIPPYYIGAFISICVVLLQAVLGLAIFIRGKDCVNKLEAAEKIGCVMQSYCMMAIVSNVGYLVAILVVGFTGVCSNSECSYTETGENRQFAVTLLVFICVGVITSAIGLAIVCKYSSSFGLKMLSRGQYQISNLVDNTDAVIAYIAAEQTAGTNETENQPSTDQYHHHHSHPDTRLAFPEPDFSTQHLQHYLTQQYRDRIRKRRRKNKKRNRENNPAEDTRRRRRRQHEREAPYVLPPVTGTSYHHQSRSPMGTPPPPAPSPPPPPVHYPPPSPSTSPTASPPQSRRTPPLTPSALPLPDIIPPPPSPSPESSQTPSPPPPTPPLNYPGVIHVIPCGEILDEDPLYSV